MRAPSVLCWCPGITSGSLSRQTNMVRPLWPISADMSQPLYSCVHPVGHWYGGALNEWRPHTLHRECSGFPDHLKPDHSMFHTLLHRGRSILCLLWWPPGGTLRPSLHRCSLPLPRCVDTSSLLWVHRRPALSPALWGRWSSPSGRRSAHLHWGQVHQLDQTDRVVPEVPHCLAPHPCRPSHWCLEYLGHLWGRKRQMVALSSPHGLCAVTYAVGVVQTKH